MSSDGSKKKFFTNISLNNPAIETTAEFLHSERSLATTNYWSPFNRTAPQFLK